MSTFTSTSLIKISFVGLNGTGSVSVSGLKSGDNVLAVANAGNPPFTNSFETIVSSDNAIQQTSGSDLSGFTFEAVLSRFS